MGFAQTEIFVHFEVEFNEEATVLLKGREIVNGQAHALSDGADGFKGMLTLGGAGFCVYDHIGGHDVGDAFFDSVSEEMNLLEAGGARNGNGGIDEMAIAGAADAHALDIQHAIHLSNRVGDLPLQARGGGIE